MADWQGQLTSKIKDMFPARENAKPESNSTKMLLAMNHTGKHVYQGTVPLAVKQRRRAKNKVARASRRAGR